MPPHGASQAATQRGSALLGEIRLVSIFSLQTFRTTRSKTRFLEQVVNVINMVKVTARKNRSCVVSRLYRNEQKGQGKPLSGQN